MSLSPIQLKRIQALVANKLGEIEDEIGLTGDCKLTFICRNEKFPDGYLIVSSDELEKAMDPLKRAIAKPNNGEVPGPGGEAIDLRFLLP